MAQRTSAMALGGLAGGLLCLSSGNQQAFTAAPATTNLRQQRAAQSAHAVPSSSASASLSAVACGGVLAAGAAAAAASGRTSRSHGSTPLPTTVMPVRKAATARKALDQSSRYADLSLDEATLIKNGKHVLVAYIMKPKAMLVLERFVLGPILRNPQRTLGLRLGQ